MLQVYDLIASHFSSTRFAVWPKVRAFLQTLPAGSVVADVGCGNGKYLGVRPDLAVLGSDRSAGAWMVPGCQWQHRRIPGCHCCTGEVLCTVFCHQRLDTSAVAAAVVFYIMYSQPTTSPRPANRSVWHVATRCSVAS